MNMSMFLVSVPLLRNPVCVHEYVYVLGQGPSVKKSRMASFSVPPSLVISPSLTLSLSPSHPPSLLSLSLVLSLSVRPSLFPCVFLSLSLSLSRARALSLSLARSLALSLCVCRRVIKKEKGGNTGYACELESNLFTVKQHE
jgi:hypothetical protein